jgi:FkbM family methyltransferase
MGLNNFLNSRGVEKFRRSFAKTTGIYFKLKRFTASTSDDLRLAKILNWNKVDYVIDIGANRGQFAVGLLDFGYKGKIVSFEPVGSVHQELSKVASKYDRWEVAKQIAIGSENGEVEINVSDNSVFSSILNIKKSHVEQKDYSKTVRTETVKIGRLDDVLPEYLDVSAHRVLLKIDTQGFEKQVLDGAPDTLSKIQGLKIEMPLTPIYEGVNYTFYDIIDVVRARGFQPYSFNREGVNLETGRINTMDGLFLLES